MGRVGPGSRLRTASRAVTIPTIVAVLGDEKGASGSFAHADEGGGDAFVGRGDLKGVAGGDGDGVLKEGGVNRVGGQGDVDAGEGKITVRAEVDPLGIGDTAFRAFHASSSFAPAEFGDGFGGRLWVTSRRGHRR